jgi:hypothetical protein
MFSTYALYNCVLRPRWSCDLSTNWNTDRSPAGSFETRTGSSHLPKPGIPRSSLLPGICYGEVVQQR